MIEQLPQWVNWLFSLTVITTIILFYFANGKPKQLTIGIIAWSILQSVLSYSGFYTKIDVLPPRFLLVLIPSLLCLLFGLKKQNRDWIIKQRKTEISTFLHLVRIPVEIVLLYLFIYKMVPELMTFEGRNFDIIAGLTAPIIGVLWIKKKINYKILILWNSIALALVLFILINGLLSSDLPIQQFGFDQPNRAINYFPFILLPATIVPIVIYTHIIDLLKLIKDNKR